MTIRGNGVLRAAVLAGSVILALFQVAPRAAAAGGDEPKMKDIPHPFILWTKDEAAAIRKRIDTDETARKQYERMIAKGNPTLANLFKYAVMGDQAAGETEKKNLLGFIGQVPEPLTPQFKAEIQKRLDAVGGDWDKIWARGGASFADRHMRDEQSFNTLRYDVLYEILTPAEREGVEKAMRTYVQFHLDGHKPWHADFKYGRMTWLPNMSWPRAIGAHLQAVALKDQKLMEGMFNSLGGWKWFMDEYLTDGRFYNEEFAKYYSNIGTMCMYADALEKLGLGRFGWGYAGKGGGCMKNFLEMSMWIGYPRTDIPGGMPQYRRVTMGDARAPDGIMEHSVVNGYTPDGKGGDGWWSGSHMNGPFLKAHAPLWFEWGHRRFPDAGFDYFLAQMRAPGEDVYLPSVYMGLGPVDPRKTKPPAAPSYLAWERGFAFLRAEESPAYWESSAPAVAQQFGFYFAHYAHDCFSILGMQAFNRPIYMNYRGGPVEADITNPPSATNAAGKFIRLPHYVNEHIKSGPPTGYIGRHPWYDTTRGHCGVVVDFLQARPIESGEQGLTNHIMRTHFDPVVKFVAGRAKPGVRNIHSRDKDVEPGVFPGVEMERALMLTREYLFDLFWLKSDRKRIYDWNVHGAGSHVLDGRYKPTSELNGSMLYREPGASQPEGYENRYDGNDLRQVHKMLPGGETWSNIAVQDCLLDNVSTSKMGKAWYDRGIGVRVTMLGERDTTVFAGRPPTFSPEWGGHTLLVRRECPATTFVALHEPFDGGVAKAPATKFERIAQTAGAVAARVSSDKVNDRLLLAYGPVGEEPIALEGDGERFVFTSWGFVRVGKDTVEASGTILEMAVKVDGRPKLLLNGRKVQAAVASGVLRFAAEGAKGG
jgi:hypothetical protein